MELDRAIKVLEQGGLAYCEAEADEFCEAYDYAVNTLKQKQWIIEQYEHEIDLLEQDLNDNNGYPTVMDVILLSTKLAVYRCVLNDLKGDGEE